MKTQTFITGLLGTVVVASPITSPIMVPRQAGGGCSAVHVVVARASTEPQGEGLTGSLSSSVKRAIPGTTSEAVVYTAKLAPYGPSEIQGVANAKSQVAAYVKKCPTSKIVLMGYSQGADVVGSVVCGGGDFSGSMSGVKVELGPPVPPIDPQVGRNIVAVVMMGDPRFTAGRSFNKGTAKTSGQFPHTATQDCKGYESRMVSYCDDGDEFCAKGKSLGPHMAYMGKYATEAASFIKSQVSKLTVPLPAVAGPAAPAAEPAAPAAEPAAEPAGPVA